MKNYFKIYARLSNEGERIYVSDGYISVENNEIIEGYATTDYLVGAYDEEEGVILLVFSMIDYIENLVYTLQFTNKTNKKEIEVYDLLKFVEMENELEITITEKIVDSKKIQQIERQIEYIKNLQ